MNSQKPDGRLFITTILIIGIFIILSLILGVALLKNKPGLRQKNTFTPESSITIVPSIEEPPPTPLF
jgi:hypothetical protein